MKDYKKILEGVVNIISTTEESEIISNICSYIDENCPELGIKAKDEKIRKSLVGYFNQYATDGIEKFNGLKVKDVIAWLEKQGEQQTLYIRFGEIPDNEKSKIYCGEEEIGEEDGVSVYPAFEVNGNIVLGLTLPITKTTLYTQQHLLEYENRPCYLVKGDYVGKDADGQPLIHNVQIIKKIDNYRVKEEKVDNAEPKTEPTFLFKVNYNGKEYNVRGIFGDVSLELYDELESNPNHFIYASLDDCEIIKGGYGIKENGFSYPTKPATFSEQESVKVNKTEPKFQPGDWVVCEDDCSVHQIKGCFENLSNHTYDYELTEGGHISGDDVNKYHTWTLDDAKDGDVLVSTATNKPFIYNGSSDDTHVGAYCGINVLNAYKTAYPPYFWAEKKSIAPATEEQRDTLLTKMKEEGYTFDFDKKELNKIIKFKIGDWIVEPREVESDVLWHIEKIENGFYLDGSVGVSIEEADKYFHAWNLEEDGTDGDILVSLYTNKPFIYNGNYNDIHVGGYCGLTFGDEFTIASGDHYWTEKKDVKPATKEQRDFLFERMKEANYMWDFSNKKPVKIKTN